MTPCKSSQQLLRHILPFETVIFIILVGFGVLLLYHPLINDKGASATLVGALWGGSAILLGNGLNRRYEHKKAAEELEERRSNLKTLLMTEIVRIMIQHVDNLKSLRRIEKSVHTIKSSTLSSYIPRDSDLFNRFGATILCLPEKEIDALATFYGNLNITRKSILDWVSKDTDLLGFQLSEIINNMKHDCEIATKVISLLAPNRKIQLAEKEPILLVDVLKKAAQGED